MDFFNLNLSLHQTLYTIQEAGLTIPGPEAVKEKKIEKQTQRSGEASVMVCLQVARVI